MLMTGIRAQLYDNTWIAGNGAAKIQFSGTQIITDSFDNVITGSLTWASICDKEGELQFFTSGTYVYDKHGNQMIGGFGICDDEITNANELGLPFNHGALCLPKKGNKYYIINFSISDAQVTSGNLYSADQLFYSVVDIDLNNGLGQVVSKRNVLYDQPMLDNHLTACRHANGRDWWLIANGYQNNSYLKWLVTPDSISAIITQNIGASYAEPDLVGQIIFSPDGTKFAGVSGNSKLNLLDFDRCNGEFSGAVSLTIPNDTVFPEMKMFGGGGFSVAFSPSGRFLYLLNKYFIYQYDLTEQDLTGTRKKIYEWHMNDGSVYTSEGYLTPNGKILISNYHGVGNYGYNVIEYPDSLGISCNYQSHILNAPTANCLSINNTFNYRLGPLTGSACDTIINDVEDVTAENSYIKITPNPAKDKLQLSLYKYLPNAQLIIADELGRVVYENHHYYLDEYLDISQWQKGIYFVKIYNRDKSLTGRFVVGD